MTTAAACTVRTQYGSGVSSGNSSRTRRPVDPPPLTARLRGRSSAELLLRSDFPFLPPFPAPREKQCRAQQAREGSRSQGTEASESVQDPT